MNKISNIIYISFLIIASVAFAACNSGNKDSETAKEQVTATPQSGDHVPSNLVCMVNNAYMGVPQLEVAYEGKMYYGCCAMCQERIPKDKKARVAVDPYSLKDVDKADAYIVLVGDRGEVVYFENEKNYRELMAKSDLNKKSN